VVIFDLRLFEKGFQVLVNQQMISIGSSLPSKFLGKFRLCTGNAISCGMLEPILSHNCEVLRYVEANQQFPLLHFPLCRISSKLSTGNAMLDAKERIPSREPSSAAPTVPDDRIIGRVML
jgi:hypothetical protein